MHELSLWLAAGVLNVRAERSIQFPEQQEIGELRLNFIRLADDASRAKRLIIRICPVAAGMAALWAIAVHIFQWEELLAVATAGSIDGVVEALSSLMRTADVWLWFYLAFVIANTMFPTLSGRSDRREKALVFVAAPLLALVSWRLGGAANPAIAVAIEESMSSVGLVMAQVLFVTVFAVFVLGILEAAIERVSNRSVSFRDGKMVTISRAEAEQHKLNRRRGSQASRDAQPKPNPARSLASIYDIKLPIPGPPGREPVSRSAVAVVNLDLAETPALKPAAPKGGKAGNEIARIGEAALQPPVSTGSGKDSNTIKLDAEATKVSPPNPTGSRDDHAAIVRPEDREDAPFDRPFVEQDTADGLHKDRREDIGAEASEPFARPFTMASRGSVEGVKGVSGELKASDRATAAPGLTAIEQTESGPASVVKKPSRIRPVPKPSQRKHGASEQPVSGDDNELEYVAIDDDLLYDDDDEIIDDAP